MIGFTVLGSQVQIVTAAPMDLGPRNAVASAMGVTDGFGYFGVGMVAVDRVILMRARVGMGVSFSGGAGLRRCKIGGDSTAVQITWARIRSA